MHIQIWVVRVSDSTVLSDLITQYTGTEIQNEILTLLLSNGADPNIGKVKFCDYKTLKWFRFSLLDYARKILHNKDLANQLISHGAEDCNY